MKIGIFDSGLGGLVMLRGLLRTKLRSYDFIFLGDTKNLPYGDKSQDQIYKLTIKAIECLFKQDCALVILACNTSSSQALRKIQQEWLPKSKWKDRKVLGIIRPTVEYTCLQARKQVGIIGTRRTIDSKAYLREFEKVNPRLKIIQKTTPKLVPMIESGKFEEKVLIEYLKPFKQIDTLILACTHYGLLKKQIKNIVGDKVKVIAQEDLLPRKLNSYLIKHKEIVKKLSKNSKTELLVTKKSPQYPGNFKIVKY